MGKAHSSREYNREYAKKHREENRKRNLADYYRNKEKRLTKAKLWQDNNKEKHLKCVKSYADKVPEKIKARNLAYRHIKKPKSQICCFCGKEEAKIRHHPDYSKPLAILFLCRRCHFNLHHKLNSEKTAEKVKKLSTI